MRYFLFTLVLVFTTSIFSQEAVNNTEKPPENESTNDKSYFFRLKVFNFHSHTLKTNYLFLETIDFNINEVLTNYAAYNTFNTENSSNSPTSHFSFDYYWNFSNPNFQNIIFGYLNSYQSANLKGFSYENGKYGSTTGKIEYYNTDLYIGFKTKFDKYNITPKVISRIHKNVITYSKYSFLYGHNTRGNKIDNKRNFASANLIYGGLRLENNLKDELQDWSLIAEYTVSGIARGEFDNYHIVQETQNKIENNVTTPSNSISVEIDRGIYNVKGENISIGLKYKFDPYTNIYFERYLESYYYKYVQTSGLILHLMELLIE